MVIVLTACGADLHVPADYATLADAQAVAGSADVIVVAATRPVLKEAIAEHGELFHPDLRDGKALEDDDEEPVVAKRTPTKHKRGAASGLRVDGIDGVMGQPANCCKPVPGDAVVGFISRGRGVVVHRRDCPNILHAREPERLMEVDWSRDHRQRYPVKIDILVKDSRGVLRDVAGALSDIGINLAETQSRRHEDRATQSITATLEIREHSELQRAIARLQRLSCVLDVHRADD